jgi:acetylornithine/succinyldiaminopimelate/putrescine aminotransferase
MLSTCFKRRDVVMVRASNALLWDREGKRYIDFVSARSTANLGHCHPEIVAAVETQLRKLIHYTNEFHIDVQDEYSRALEAFLPEGLTRHYLCSTGAEAIEAAIKLARARTRKPGVVAFTRAFHGRTLGALSVTYKEAYRAPFQPLIDGMHFVPPSADAVLRVLDAHEVGAILFEPVQGESGVRPLGDDLIRSLRRVATERDVLLVADEVQSGFGRCGGRFYCDRIGVRPDVLLASKSIAGGLPLGIVATRPELDFEPGEHGSTFSGHPIACAAGLAALSVFQRERLDLRSIEMERTVRALLSPFAELPGIRELRVVGAMAGLEIDPEVIDGVRLVDECLAHGLLVNFTGDTVIRLMPPLTIEAELLRQGIEILRSVLKHDHTQDAPQA